MPFDFRGFLHFLRAGLLRGPWTRRRMLVGAAFVLVVPVLELLIWAGLLLDELLHPRYRRQPIEAPLFIIGNPRSGTTFLHRLLAKDVERFSAMRMWEILFAPSIVGRGVVRGLARLDALLGGPMRRLLERAERGWAARNSMHDVSLLAPEEDDYVLLHVWSALSCWLSCGLLDEARRYTFFDSVLAESDRARIMRFYRRCIQRHLLADVVRARSPGRRMTYLAKNPALCPKLASVLDEFPDARFVYLVRNPLEMVPSYLSMMRYSWRAAGIEGSREALRDYMLEMAGHWYRYPLDKLAELSPDRAAVVKYDDLIRDPEAAVAAIYARFGFGLTPSFRAVLRAESERAKRYQSRHDYAADEPSLCRRILAELGDVLERCGFTKSGPGRADAGGAGVRASSFFA